MKMHRHERSSSPPSVELLNRFFCLPGYTRCRLGEGRLPIIDLKTPHSTATISLLGGQLIAFQLVNEQPVIWVSPRSKYKVDQAIRGGIPVCWPWFAQHKNLPEAPAHGLARTAMWKVVKTEKLPNEEVLLVLELPMETVASDVWPHSSRLEQRITLGKTLSVELITTNLGNDSLEVTEALHTYLHVGDVREIEVRGLEGISYLDKMQNRLELTQQGPVKIESPVDRIYQNTQATCELIDPVLKRRILVHKTGSGSTIVWNPWKEKASEMADMGEGTYEKMLCIETANVESSAIQLSPGQEHRMGLRLEIVPL